MTLTQKDIDEIERIMDEKISEAVLRLPTKDEFYTKMDEVVGKLDKILIEKEVGDHQLSDHEDRITTLEKLHPQGQHAS